jgi:anti-sigma factor RsiW
MKNDDYSWVQDYLDGRLGPEEMAQAEKVLGESPDARAELEALKRVRALMKSTPSAPVMPADLQARVRDALDLEEGRIRQEPVQPSERRLLWYRPALAAAAAVVLALGLWGIFTPSSDGFIDQVYARYEQTVTKDCTQFFSHKDPECLKKFLNDFGRSYDEAMLNVGMEGFVLENGVVGPLGDRPSAVMAYQHPDRQRIVCQMYEGQLEDLPEGGEVFGPSGLQVRIFRRGNVTMAFWQDGQLVCVLSSSVESGQLIQLALKKANPGLV